MLNKKNAESTFCGFVAIVGRPNVGKSSLINALVAKKISIISYRPQTTRHQILGVKTEKNRQIVYVDTPGLHLNGTKAVNQYMNKQAMQSVHDVNAVIFVIEALKWTQEDSHVSQVLAKLECPIIVAINKIDLHKDKKLLLPFLLKVQEQLPKATLVPISALKKIQIDDLEQLIQTLIPASPFYFSPDDVSNRDGSFHLSELIREPCMLMLQAELPYAVHVAIEKVFNERAVTHVHALILVERESQKHILIGKDGEQLKKIGTHARHSMEQYLGHKVFLKLWVKVKENWSNSPSAMKDLGFD